MIIINRGTNFASEDKETARNMIYTSQLNAQKHKQSVDKFMLNSNGHVVCTKIEIKKYTTMTRSNQTSVTCKCTINAHNFTDTYAAVPLQSSNSTD